MRNKKKSEYLYNKYNRNIQMYKGIPLRLIVYTEDHFKRLNAKRFVINDSNQNVWIPNRYLLEDGTIKKNINIDFVFRNCEKKFLYAGINNDLNIPNVIK